MRKLLAITVVLGLASMASADTVLDNIGDMSQLTGNTHAAQDFESAYDVYDCAVVDDFTLTGDGWTLDSIEAVVGFWNGAGTEDIDDPVGYNIDIFSDSALIGTTLVGDVYSLPMQAYATGDVNTGLVQFDVSIPLNAGTYWISVQPSMVYASFGQCGVQSTTLGDLNGVQGNPGGGFGLPNNMQGIDLSAAYRINGFIPEPASLLLFGLAGLMIRRR